jgi:hypothetical protein
MCLGMMRKGDEILMFDAPTWHTHGEEPGMTFHAFQFCECV